MRARHGRCYSGCRNCPTDLRGWVCKCVTLYVALGYCVWRMWAYSYEWDMIWTLFLDSPSILPRRLVRYTRSEHWEWRGSSKRVLWLRYSLSLRMLCDFASMQIFGVVCKSHSWVGMRFIADKMMYHCTDFYQNPRGSRGVNLYCVNWLQGKWRGCYSYDISSSRKCRGGQTRGGTLGEDCSLEGWANFGSVIHLLTWS